VPQHKITNSMGLIDVHLVRRVIVTPTEDQFSDERLIQTVGSELLVELQQIVMSRALALGANCVLSFKIEISKI